MNVKRSKVFTIVTFILLLSVSVFLESKEISKKFGSINGTLIESTSRHPLPGTEVLIVGTKRITLTDEDGKFSLSNIPVGTYSLKFSLDGMKPQIQTDIIIKSSRTSVVNAKIQLISLLNETITVTANYFNQEPDQPTNTVNFSNEEIRRAPGTGGDVSRIIASLPSIAQVTDQSNNLVVRGGSSHENLFIIDNIQIPNINHFPFQGSGGGAVSLINVDFIDDVEFFAGGFSPIYGDRLSSVMNLSFREGNREKFNGQLTLDFTGAGLNIEGPIPGKKGMSQGSWMLSARRSYIDLLSNIMDTGADIKYSDIQGKIVYDLSARSKLTLLGIVGSDNSTVSHENAIDQGETLFGITKNQEHTIGLNWFWMWSDKGYSNTSISNTKTKFDYNFRKTATDTLYLDNLSEDESFHIRNVNHLNLSYNQKIQFGFEVHHYKSKYNYFTASYIDSLGQQIDETKKDINIKANKASLFFNYSLTVFSKLSFNLGLRTDYFSYTGKTTYSPRSTIILNISDRTSLSASLGIFKQNLPLLLLYQNEKNKELEDPSTLQYSLGLNHIFGDSIKLNVEAYYKKYEHFPVDPQQQSLCLLDNIFGFSLFGDNPLSDKGKASSYGVEFTLQKKLKEKLYGMISGSLFSTRYRDLNGKWYNRIFDNRYIFAIQGGYKPNQKWEFSLKWTIAGGRPYTPFDITLSEQANSGIFDQAQINSKRMPAYHSLNLRFDRRFYFNKSNLTMYLSVWNVYNNKNVASRYWNEIENKPDYSYQFSTLPVFGIEFEF